MSEKGFKTDEDSFSRKSAKFRKDYIQAVKVLYGDLQDLPKKPKNKPKVKRKIDPLGEYIIQCKLVAMIRKMGYFVISIPNQGKRSVMGHQKEAAMGMWKGASDLFLIEPSHNGQYPGYFIELKGKGLKPRDNQLEFMEIVRKRGFKADWFDNLEDAQNAALEYLGHKA